MIKNSLKNILKNILFFVGLLAAWQLIYYLGTQVLEWWKPYAVPNPIGVWNSFVRLLMDGGLLLAVLASLKRAFLGFVISIVLGGVIGLAITNSSYLNQNLKPVLLGVQALPSICWVPFAILWYGLNEKSIIFVVVMGSIFSISLTVENGFKSVLPIYVKAAKTMGANQKDLYFRVLLPAALPTFIVGLKQGWSFAWRALMAGEVMSATIGLGYTLMMGRDTADINQVMAVMVIIVIVGIVIEKLIFDAVERKVLSKRGLIKG